MRTESCRLTATPCPLISDDSLCSVHQEAVASGPMERPAVFARSDEPVLPHLWRRAGPAAAGGGAGHRHLVATFLAYARGAAVALSRRRGLSARPARPRLLRSDRPAADGPGTARRPSTGCRRRSATTPSPCEQARAGRAAGDRKIPAGIAAGAARPADHASGSSTLLRGGTPGLPAQPAAVPIDVRRGIALFLVIGLLAVARRPLRRPLPAGLAQSLPKIVGVCALAPADAGSGMLRRASRPGTPC